MAGPRLRHPGRDYLLFHGPLSAASRIGHQVTDSWFLPQSPSLLWAADESWLLATEIDFDSTLIGGSRPLIDAVLNAPGWRPGRCLRTRTSPFTATTSTPDHRGKTPTTTLRLCSGVGFSHGSPILGRLTDRRAVCVDWPHWR
jgi:hypothetical protein